MKLRLPFALVAALLACFQLTVTAASFDLTEADSLETSSLGGGAYTLVSPPVSGTRWDLSQFELHIGREKATSFTVNSGATLSTAGISLYAGSTVNLAASLSTASFNSLGGAINLLANAVLSTGSIVEGTPASNISGIMTLDSTAKWNVKGSTTFGNGEGSKIVLGERTTSQGNFGSASLNVGTSQATDAKTVFTTYIVEGSGSAFIGKSGVWQAYGNTTLNRLDNVGSLIIGDGTNAAVFTTALSGGQAGTVHISQNATWVSNGKSSQINVGKVTVEGTWDMSNGPLGSKDPGVSQGFLTQGVELRGGSTIRMNLVDTIKMQSGGPYELTFTGSGPYNLDLVYNQIYAQNYTLMTFSNAFDASQFTLVGGGHSSFELRTETSSSTTSLIWTYLTNEITYNGKNRSKKWTFNEGDPHGFATSNFDVIVNKNGVLSTTKGTVFSQASISINDGGKWNITGSEAISLGANMRVLVQNGGLLTSSAVLRINGLAGEAAASLTVTGATSSWTATNDVYIASVAGGSGVVNISDGAKWTTNGAVWLSQDEQGNIATDNSSTINLNGSTWTSTGTVTGSANSSVNISAGSTWDASAYITVGSVLNNGTWTSAQGISVGSLVNNGVWNAGGDSFIASSLTNTGNLYVGGLDSVGTISTQSATLTGGSLFFDYAVAKQDQLNIAGALQLSGPITIDLGIHGWMGSEGGGAMSYTLISYNAPSSMIDTSQLVLKGLWLGSTRQQYSLDFSTAGEIRLLVTGQAARLTWNGANGDVWKLDSTTWTPDPTTADNHFRNTDYVLFDGEKELSVEGSVWASILGVTASSNITMNAGSGQIIANITQNDGLLTLNGGDGHRLGVVSNAVTGVLTLNGVTNAEIASITGGVLDIIGGSVVSITDGGSKLGTLSGDGVLMVQKSFAVQNAISATIQLNSDASIDIVKLDGSTLELNDGSSAKIGEMSKGKLQIGAAKAQITKISGGNIVMNNGDVSIDRLVGSADNRTQYEMNGGKLLIKTLDSGVDFSLKGGLLEIGYCQSSNSSLLILGGEARSSSFIMGSKGMKINVDGGKLMTTGLVQVPSFVLSSGEVIVGAIVGGGTNVFTYNGGDLKFNLSLNLELYKTLAPIGSKPDHYSFLHDMSSNNSSIDGTLADSLKTGDVFGAELLVNVGGGADLLGKTFSISNDANVDFGAIKIEGSLLKKTEAGKSGIWSFGGLNFGYQFDGNKLVFDSYASEITKPPVVTPNPDGSGWISEHEEVILNTGNSSMKDDTLNVSITPSGDTPGSAGQKVDIQLGSGLENVAHAGVKGTSLATYTVKEFINEDGSIDKTDYVKSQDVFGLLISGTEVLKSASEQTLAVMGKVDGTANTAIASINSSAGTSLTLDNTQIYLSNEDPDRDYKSRIESTTITLKGAALLSGVSVSNAIQMNNSTVQGIGSLKNISFNGGKLCAGNSPGVMNLNNISTAAITGSYGQANSMVFQAQICNFGSNVVLNGMNSDTGATGNVSQFNITGDVVLGKGTVFEIVLWNDGNVGNLDTKTLEQGAKFQFFTFNGGRIIGEFAGMLNAPVLADGLMWDISQLTTGGFAQVIWSSIADGSRIANTLWTSGQTVANISTEAVKHVGEAVTGKTTVWLSSLNDFTRANSAGSTTGYDFNTQGYSVGAQRGIEGGHVIGLAFGNSYGTHTPLQESTHASAGKIKQDAVMGTIYGRVMLSKATATDKIWSIDAYAGYGEVSNKSDRTVNYDSSNAHAKWDDMVKTLGIQANYAKKLNERTIVTPFAGLDFIHGEQDSFTEYAKSVKASYDNGAYYNLRASLGAGISHVVEFSNGMALIPSLSASYGYDICRMNPHTDVSEAAGNYRAYGVNPGRNSFQITPALSWKINKAWSASTNYTLRTRSGLTDQSVNASVSYTF